jgi:hypothetical protein
MQIQECKGSRKREGEHDGEGFIAMMERTVARFVEIQSSLDMDKSFHMYTSSVIHCSLTVEWIGIRKGLQVSLILVEPAFIYSE